MIPTYKVPTSGYIKQGDTIDAINFKFTGFDFDLTTCSIRMQVYNGASKIIDIENGLGITIVSATEVEIDKILKNNFPTGVFIGDFEITTATGERFTFFNIEYTIIKEFTK